MANNMKTIQWSRLSVGLLDGDGYNLIKRSSKSARIVANQWSALISDARCSMALTEVTVQRSGGHGWPEDRKGLTEGLYGPYMT